jgi:hypothetical protein
MLSDEEKAGLERMSPEDLGKLLTLIRQVRAEFGHRGAMPASAVQAMVDAVGDQQVRDIVKDLRSLPEPGFLPASEVRSPKEQRSAPLKELPLEARRDIRWIDQMVDVQDALDKAERAKGFGSAFGGGPKVLRKDDEKEV